MTTHTCTYNTVTYLKLYIYFVFFLNCRPSPEINNGASTSSLALLGGMSSTLVKNVRSNDSHENHENHIITSTDSLGISQCATQPTTPVAAITPNLNSPLSELAPSTASTNPMTSPIVVTTVEILDLVNI